MGPGAALLIYTIFPLSCFLTAAPHIQSVLELAASSASPDTFIQTVLTKVCQVIGFRQSQVFNT